MPEDDAVPEDDLAADALIAPASGVERLQFHGFVSQGFLVSSGNNFLARSKRGSFEFAEAALNANADLTDTVNASMQMFARDLGPIGDYSVKLDWFHLDWRPRDEFGLRAGRVRMPFGLYNETSDYDPGRTSVLLPQSLYSARTRDFLLALTGADLYGVINLGGAGFLDYRLVGGSLFIDASESSVPVEIDVPYTVASRVMWEPPIAGLKLGASVLALELQGTLDTTTYELPAILWVSSIEWHRQKLLLAAEYSRWHTDLTSSDEMVIPSAEVTSERFYLMAGYELRPDLKAAAYHSVQFEDIDQRSNSAEFQHDTAATLRFDINPHWLVKGEGHYMYGTAAATLDLNPGDPADRPEHWVVLLLKTTAYF